MEPFVGQIMQVGFNYAPHGWAQCNGQLINPAQQQALFSLLGTTFGGNGQTTFGLPDARGRVFVGTGQGPGLQPYSWGQIGGVENTTLNGQQLPMHTHMAAFTPTGSSFSGQLQAKTGLPSSNLQATPTQGSFLANCADTIGDSGPAIYAPASTAGTAVNLGGISVSGTVAGSVAVQPAGGSQPVSLMQPYLGVMTVIALQGIWPSRN